MYEELDASPCSKRFSSVMTCGNMVQQLQANLQGKQQLFYHRIPVNDDAAPHAKVLAHC